VAVVVGAVSGAPTTATTASVATQIQTSVPGHLRGRVMSLNTLCLIGLSPVGAFLSASLATALPIQAAVVAAASVMLLYLAVTLLMPRVRRAWMDVP
jgi:hypothetical protein